MSTNESWVFESLACAANQIVELKALVASLRRGLVVKSDTDDLEKLTRLEGEKRTLLAQKDDLEKRLDKMVCEKVEVMKRAYAERERLAEAERDKVALFDQRSDLVALFDQRSDLYTDREALVARLAEAERDKVALFDQRSDLYTDREALVAQVKSQTKAYDVQALRLKEVLEENEQMQKKIGVLETECETYSQRVCVLLDDNLKKQVESLKASAETESRQARQPPTRCGHSGRHD